MTINPDRWTLKTQEAFTAAVDRARAAHNAEVTPESRAGRRARPGRRHRRPGPHPGRRRAGRGPRPHQRPSLARLPQAFGGQEPAIDRALRDVLTAADAARTDMGDEYLSVEHLLLAMADRLGVEPRPAAQRPARRPGQPPGHLAEPRGDLPGPRALRPGPHHRRPPGQDRPGHRPRRGDPSRHPGAVPPHQEQPGAHRRARRGQDRHRRGPGHTGSSRATSPRA